ncbi:hypothetical protein C8F04DRAFT_1281445 [Mycena alexandri]|uniref:Endonuclease/exonuclease/phosphatase domain-containing protein n=1 Tax=Mycena alexandri TaxID=1745969 RepID=A0AAD6RY56_9AGAR|nr:hypothetical protein C8F04DRAFT_1281445 [Mycena alexandri]
MGAGILSDAVATIRAYSSAAPTTECLAMLDAICDRLRVHHELLGAGDDETSFSTIVTRSVVDPVKTLTKQVESQHKAIQTTPSTSTPSPSTGAPNYAKVVASTARASPRPKPRQPPFTKDRPLFKDIVAELNAYLVPLGLPEILFVQRQVGEAGPVHFPSAGQGGSGDSNETVERMAPGWMIPFAAAGSEEEVCKEFEERNPDLGKVNGWRWVNPPPSEGRISALRGLGRKPPTAGSMVLRLESRERVDVAVMRGRVIMAGGARQVSRAFPHLKPVQCWGCYRYNHTRARCREKTTTCGGCGGASHGVGCSETPTAAEAARTQMTCTIVQTNTERSRNPLDTLLNTKNFDIIAIQEPWAKLSTHHDHSGYRLVTPNCDTRHRVAMLFREATIPPSSICARPDLSKSSDLLVVEAKFDKRTITLIDLYIDSETRVGVQLLAAREEDIELHDLLMARPVTLVTPPMNRHTSLG